MQLIRLMVGLVGMVGIFLTKSKKCHRLLISTEN